MDEWPSTPICILGYSGPQYLVRAHGARDGPIALSLVTTGSLDVLLQPDAPVAVLRVDDDVADDRLGVMRRLHEGLIAYEIDAYT